MTDERRCDKCGLRAVDFYGRHARCEIHMICRSTRVTDAIAIAREMATESGIKGSKGPLRGPCALCGTQFRSYANKRFCSLVCYSRSGERAARARESLEKARAMGRASYKSRLTVACAHCGDEKEVRPSLKGRLWNFCNRVCMRAFYSARFDAFIANPESIALPQNYDEFLDNTELRCPVRGCDWIGKALSYHARLVHCIKAEDFKMMLGFNITSGLISKDLASRLSEAKQAVPRDLQLENVARMREGARVAPRAYVSLESTEHRRKAMMFRPRVYQPLSEETKRKISETKRQRRRPLDPLTCSACGCVFYPMTRRVRFCSNKCALSVARAKRWGGAK